MLLAAYGSDGGGYGAGFLAGIAVVAVVLGLISMNIWKGKGGSPAIGFVLGFFLGIIGLIIVALAKPTNPRTTDQPPPPGAPPPPS
jgi:hypothetical protein